MMLEKEKLLFWKENLEQNRDVILHIDEATNIEIFFEARSDAML